METDARAEKTMRLSDIDDRFLFCHIKPGDSRISVLPGINGPEKSEGTLLFLVNSGSGFRIEVNFEQEDISPGTLLMVFPGNVVRMLSPVPDDTDAYLLYFDIKFLRGVSINLTSVQIPPSITRRRPAIHLSEEESDLLVKYFLLLHESTDADQTNQQVVRSIATNLTAALFYQLIIFHHRRIAGEITSQAHIRMGSRRNDYVREFIRLVHIHYTRERSVGFYADKLFISPKYLSLLVKEATGRTAAGWIDEFVLMEAKNMLRFSGKNIQQIAYALNFPTQSSFGKYFKHLTGLSPTEYQKS